jgi:hypothetical protein
MNTGFSELSLLYLRAMTLSSAAAPRWKCRFTRALADLLIDGVRVFPGGGIKIDWRFADYFSGEAV